MKKFYNYFKMLKKPFVLFLALAISLTPLTGCSCGSNAEGGNTPKEDEKIIDLTGQTDLASSVTYSNKVKNGVQAIYNSTGDYVEGSYIVTNKNCSFSHTLKGNLKTIEYFKSNSGKNYLINTMDVFIVNNGDKEYAKNVESDARINTTNLGYYYYTVNVRDFNFDYYGVPCYLEKIYHTYSDKINEQFRFVANGNMSNVSDVGFEVKLNKNTVSKFEIYDGIKTYSTIDGEYDKSTVQYIAFDIKDVGVIGFIMSDQTYTFNLEETSKYYIFTQQAKITEPLTSGQDFSFGNRIYNDETHDFLGIQNTNRLEQNPLSSSNFVVKDQDDASFVGYDKLKGCYEFYISGEDFNQAYYNQPNKKFIENIKISGDNYDRTLYMYVHSNYPLEGASLLDENELQVPIPVEVCKNFGHEKEEPIYDPTDKMYGDAYFPIVVEKNSNKELTLVDVYENWGNYELKQLSSISFTVSYYHISTGVHETNCIAPYYARYGSEYKYQDYGTSWFLPDFRGLSGDQWELPSDPQYNSAGMLMSVNSNDGDTLCTYQGSKLNSSGLTYSDLNYSYISDDGAYKYTMRHVEMPQTDETRTYYEISIEFLKDVTYDEGTFNLASFNGRNVTYKYSSYLDEDGEEQKITNPTTSSAEAEMYRLNSGSSYFTFYGIKEPDTKDQNNFGLIVKNSNMKVNGKESETPLAFLNDFRGKLNYGALTLADTISFKKGDTIDSSIIFLSYGSVGQTNCDNVKKVYEDSVVNPITLTASTGTVINDEYIPTVKAINNKAVFTTNGGVYENNQVNYTIKVTGCTKLEKPTIYMDGEIYDYASSDLFDGYSVICENGELTYSFVFTQNVNGHSFSFEL